MGGVAHAPAPRLKALEKPRREREEARGRGAWGEASERGGLVLVCEYGDRFELPMSCDV